MCLIYVFGAIFICGVHYEKLPFIFKLIVDDAFTGSAMIGGSVSSALLWRVRRAVFSNEAGLGTASITHAAVKTDYPVREGIVASLGPFIDTIIVCSATAAIIMGGGYGTGIYQPVSTLDTSTLQVESNWSTPTGPVDTDPIKTFRIHDNVLETAPNQTPEAIQIPISIKPNGALRFSYFKEAGNIDITLRNQTSNNSLTIGEHVATQAQGELYSIGCGRLNQ